MSQNPFDTLLDKRLVFVTGKGGVGKTTMACALALRASELGLRTVLMGIDSTAQIEEFFTMAPLTGLQMKQPREDLFALNLERQLLLDEFIKQSLKVSPLYNRVLNSSIYKYFTALAPGFRELMTLSRILEMEERKRRRQNLHEYDLLVVDAPATGHGMSLLDIPRSVLAVSPVGPFAQRARRLDAFFKDHSKMSVLMVTLAEEMPANEAVEMYTRLKDEYKLHVAGIVINNLYPPLFADVEEQERLAPMLAEEGIEDRLKGVFSTDAGRNAVPSLLESARFQHSRRNVNERYAKIVREKIDAPALDLEFLPVEKDDDKLLTMIADRFDLH